MNNCRSEIRRYSMLQPLFLYPSMKIHFHLIQSATVTSSRVIRRRTVLSPSFPRPREEVIERKVPSSITPKRTVGRKCICVTSQCSPTGPIPQYSLMSSYFKYRVQRQVPSTAIARYGATRKLSGDRQNSIYFMVLGTNEIGHFSVREAPKLVLEVPSLRVAPRPEPKRTPPFFVHKNRRVYPIMHILKFLRRL